MIRISILVFFALLPFAISAAGGVVNLRLDRGDTVSFEDQTEGDRIVLQYKAKGTLPGHPFFVVEERNPEGYLSILVSRKSGEVFNLDAVPAQSPDRKRLVTALSGFLTGRSENRLQIWRVEGDSVKLEYELKGTLQWGPKGPVFQNNTTVRFAKLFYSDFREEPRKSQVDERIRFDGEKWSFDEKFQIVEGKVPGTYKASPIPPKPPPAPDSSAADSASSAPVSP